jgi:hypothetical protein
MDREQHINFSKAALKIFQQLSGTHDEHAIADLVCDLGHLADANCIDFLQEIQRGLGHWSAERGAGANEAPAGQPDVQITIRSRTRQMA